MLNVVSSEPVPRDTKRSCVLRGSCTHCALKEALRWRSGAMKNYQVWSSVTLEFWSNLKPWINIKESVSFMQQKPFSMAPLYFYCSFFFISLTPKILWCHRNGAIQPLSHVISEGLRPGKHQVKSKRPKTRSRTERQPSPGLDRSSRSKWRREQWQTSELQQACHLLMPSCVGLWKTKFCGYTVLNEIKLFFLHGQISWIFKLFSWGCNLQKKKFSHFWQFILFLKINFTSAWF